jgi:hypothetical protein
MHSSLPVPVRELPKKTILLAFLLIFVNGSSACKNLCGATGMNSKNFTLQRKTLCN